jgi:hypothetical protein
MRVPANVVSDSDVKTYCTSTLHYGTIKSHWHLLQVRGMQIAVPSFALPSHSCSFAHLPMSLTHLISPLVHYDCPVIPLHACPVLIFP